MTTIEPPIPIPPVNPIDPEGSVIVKPVAATPAQESEKKLSTAGQRRVNLVWELTQSTIALAVCGTTLWVSSNLAVQPGIDKTAFVLLSNAFFLVVGFYFGRTNHQKVGGVSSGDTGR